MTVMNGSAPSCRLEAGSELRTFGTPVLAIQRVTTPDSAGQSPTESEASGGDVEMGQGGAEGSGFVASGDGIDHVIVRLIALF